MASLFCFHRNYLNICFRDNGQPEALPLDLTSKESVQTLADTIKTKYGKVNQSIFSASKKNDVIQTNAQL